MIIIYEEMDCDSVGQLFRQYENINNQGLIKKAIKSLNSLKLIN